MRDDLPNVDSRKEINVVFTLFLKFVLLVFMHLKRYFLLLALLAGVFIACGPRERKLARKEFKRTGKVDTFTEVKFIFAGDVMMHLPEIDAAWNDSLKGYDFSPFFQFVSPYIQQADIAVANLETTFGGKPYSGYPQFSAPDTLAYFLKNAGFDVSVTANNHAADRSTKGILGTIEGLDKAEMKHTGTFKDSAERAKNYPLILEKNGMRIALLNYTYGTNGIPVHKPVIVNFIDTAAIDADIKEAQHRKADYIIAVFHWGIEYQRQPNAEQKKIARFCLSHGVNTIIGSHPHVVQPAEWETYRTQEDTGVKKGLVVYSMGNFVSNQRQKYTDGAMIFGFSLKRNRFTKKISLENAAFEPTWVYIQPSPKGYFILPASKYEHDSTFVISAERQKMNESFEDNREHMLKNSMPWLVEMK
jgi:poly-gamma-glutamate synthesis protein (capsule biosynthesis protein)